MKTLKTQKDTGTDIETQTERQTGRQTHIELFNWYHCIIIIIEYRFVHFCILVRKFVERGNQN